MAICNHSWRDSGPRQADSSQWQQCTKCGQMRVKSSIFSIALFVVVVVVILAVLYFAFIAQGPPPAQ